MNHICVVITARPSYSRVKSLLYAIKKHPNLKLSLVLAASAILDRFGNVSSYIKSDGFDIAAEVSMVIEGDSPLNMSKTTGLGIIELASVFSRIYPDAVLTIADRYETMATAIAASYMSIPLIHLQGGEVTGSIDEKVRHSITKLADYHFPCTSVSASRLVRMGEDPARVFNFGCPSLDLLESIKDYSSLPFDPFIKYKGVGPVFDYNMPYFVVVFHSVTDQYLSAADQVKQLISSVTSFSIPIFWFWPNVDAGSDSISKVLRTFRESKPECNIHFFKNMSSTDFLLLLKFSSLLIGNSSVAIRECSRIPVKAVNIGDRQSCRERCSNVTDCLPDAASITQAIRQSLASPAVSSSDLYGQGDAGAQIADAISNLDLSLKPPFQG